MKIVPVRSWAEAASGIEWPFPSRQASWPSQSRRSPDEGLPRPSAFCTRPSQLQVRSEVSRFPVNFIELFKIIIFQSANVIEYLVFYSLSYKHLLSIAIFSMISLFCSAYNYFIVSYKLCIKETMRCNFNLGKKIRLRSLALGNSSCLMELTWSLAMMISFWEIISFSSSSSSLDPCPNPEEEEALPVSRRVFKLVTSFWETIEKIKLLFSFEKYVENCQLKHTLT